MENVNNKLVPVVQAIPLVADRVETEFAEEEVREEIEADAKVKESLQTLGLDNEEALVSEIRKAYRKLFLQYHDQPEKQKNIQDAYQLLIQKQEEKGNIDYQVNFGFSEEEITTLTEETKGSPIPTSIEDTIDEIKRDIGRTRLNTERILYFSSASQNQTFKN